jgi:peptide/nickel transport system ATP-binding protein
MNSAALLCEDICVIKDGRIVEQGILKDTLVSPLQEYTKTLIEANFANRKFRQ